MVDVGDDGNVAQLLVAHTSAGLLFAGLSPLRGESVAQSGREGDGGRVGPTQVAALHGGQATPERTATQPGCGGAPASGGRTRKRA